MSTPTMRAISQDRFGGPEVLRLVTVPRPEPLPTEVLVRVVAAGVNPVDYKTREGGGMAGVLGEPPFVLGWDVSGVVEKVGFGVHTLDVGDEVYGMPWFPRPANAYAEYVTAPARQFARKLYHHQPRPGRRRSAGGAHRVADPGRRRPCRGGPAGAHPRSSRMASATSPSSSPTTWAPT